MSKHLFLIGFMGCGKTYWGERIAKVFSLPFTDLDEYIESVQGRTIAELFVRQGESAFRQLERRYLYVSSRWSPRVIATGGGTPCFFHNLGWMKRHGVTLWIDIPFEILWLRLQGEERLRRPLLRETSFETLQQLWQKRCAYYQQADYIARRQPEDDEATWTAKVHATARTALLALLPGSSQQSKA
ncbi:MAG: shikimate kinase [Saprospiraceae bacterium]|nr:shikimate kinase [Saprospiraceae bacterium]MDW8483683.1 shikimate kinase [Saprospiraceae bacterium]